MEKTDLTKTCKNYYKASTKPELVTIEEARYLSLKGKGDPNELPFTHRVQALYSTAYALKFKCKETGNDFTVPKLEALWWFDIEKFGIPSLAEAPKVIPRSHWEYRLLIRMPDFVTIKDMKAAIENVVQSKNITLAKEVEWYRMQEGKCVQMLHIGPFSKEPESLLKMEAFMEEKGLKKNRLHHEIYLSDFRLTAPDRLKTILREPVK